MSLASSFVHCVHMISVNRLTIIQGKYFSLYQEKFGKLSEYSLNIYFIVNTCKLNQIIYCHNSFSFQFFNSQNARNFQ